MQVGNDKREEPRMITMLLACISIWSMAILTIVETLKRFELGQNWMMSSVLDIEFGISEIAMKMK